MTIYAWTTLSLIIFSANSCRSSSIGGASSSSAIQEPIAAILVINGPQEPGEDSPPIGTRSAFDYLVGTDPVPFPFTALLNKIEEEAKPEPNADDPKLAKIVGVLQPYSRSLQRRLVNPKFPRALVTVDQPSSLVASKRGMLLNRRLYVAYAEKAEALEVISYNDEAGRFEFQEVRGYAHGKTPKVYYAKRSLCVTCHQTQGPLFMGDPWNETASAGGTEGNAALLAAHPGKLSIHGITLRSPETSRVPLPATQNVSAIGDAIRFDNDANDSTMLQHFAYYWRNVCGGGKIGAECRSQIIEANLAALASGWQEAIDTSALNAKMSRTLLEKAAQIAPAGIVSDTATALRSLDQEHFPIVAGEAADQDGVLVGDYDPSSLREPTFNALIRAGGRTALDGGFVSFLASDLGNGRIKAVAKAFGGSFSRLQNALETMVGDAVAGRPTSVTYGHYQPAVVFQELIERAGSPPPKSCCDRQTPTPTLELASSLPDTTPTPADSAELTLDLLLHYCGSCHGPSAAIKFLIPGTTSQKWAALEPWAKKIVKSLQWESVPAPAKAMPLGPMRAALATKPNDRKKIVEGIKGKFGLPD